VDVEGILRGNTVRDFMKTVAEWQEKHPGVKARMFERNYKKESGTGKFEAVCASVAESMAGERSRTGT
jgi:hypothetical protein